MTDVMNLFETMFMFKNFETARPNTAAIELAIALKAEAQELAAIGDEETKNARMTQVLSSEAQTPDKRRIFAEIAAWHNNRAAEKYTKAAARFEEAGRVYTKRIRAFNKKAKQMRRLADKAAANHLNNSSINHSTQS